MTDRSRKEVSRENYPVGTAGVIVARERTNELGQAILGLVEHLNLGGTPATVAGHTGEGNLIVRPASRYLSVCIEPAEFEVEA